MKIYWNNFLISFIIAWSGAGLVFRSNEGFYGNNCTSRGSTLPSQAKRIFIDYDTTLPSGVLKSFHIFVENASTNLDGKSNKLRLQVWRPVSFPDTRAMSLVWQVKLQLPEGNSLQTLYNVNRSLFFFNVLFFLQRLDMFY